MLLLNAEDDHGDAPNDSTKTRMLRKKERKALSAGVCALGVEVCTSYYIRIHHNVP